MARGTRPTKQGAAVKGNVICVEVPLSIEPYGRIKILQHSLQGQLDKFSKSQSLQRHPASLRKSIESALIKPFQTPRLRFYIAGNEDVSYLKTFMAKNEIKWLDELQYRQCDGTEECGSGPVIHITLLEESDLLEATNAVIDFLGSKAGVGIAKDMLYVLNFEVNSRTQLQGYIERLLDRYPHIFDKKESKGCRVFHTGDEMFTDRISVLLERYIEQSLKNIFRLCENLSSSSEESLKQTRLTEVNEILQSNIGHFASKPDEKTLKQASHNVAVRFKQFLRFHPGQEAEFFDSYIADFLNGILFQKVKASESRTVSPETFVNVNTVSENILTEALAISKVYSEFVKDVKENVNKFEKQYSEIKAKLRDREIPHEVETSLVRIPGILSVGYQHKRFNISYRGSSKHEILHQLRRSIGNFTEINESSVTLCPSHVGFAFDVRSGDLVEGERKGTLTILARHGRSSRPRMYGITCAHVLPDDPDAPAYVYASDCNCPNPTNNCMCCYRSKILLGNCVYKMGPYEKNPVNSDLIDIASFMIPLEREQQCDLRVFGPENGMRIVDQGLQLEGSKVFMRGPNNDISYGQHIGFADLFPAEGLTCPLDSHPQYMYQIPFGGRPRRVELVQSENGQRLGHPGYSGALISVLKIDGGVTYMKPALMYLGAWPSESDSISMCSRLLESLDRLTEKHGGQAEFVLCYNNSGHGRESMRTNTGKRKADDS